MRIVIEARGDSYLVWCESVTATRGPMIETVSAKKYHSSKELLEAVKELLPPLLPTGWPKDIPLPTEEEARASVKEAEEDIKKRTEEMERRQRLARSRGNKPDEEDNEPVFASRP